MKAFRIKCVVCDGKGYIFWGEYIGDRVCQTCFGKGILRSRALVRQHAPIINIERQNGDVDEECYGILRQYDPVVGRYMPNVSPGGFIIPED